MRPAIAIIASLLTIMSSRAFAQMGVEIGAGYFVQNGILQAPCGCKFDGGTGSGYKISLNYDLFSVFGLTVGAKAALDRKQFSSSHLWGSGSDTALTDNMLLTTSYLQLEPYVRYRFFMGFFLQTGIGYSYLVHNNFLQNRNLLSGTFSNGSPDSLVENQPLQSVRSSMAYVPISAGYELDLLGLRIMPMITGNFPITDFSSIEGNMWNLSSYYGSVLFFF